MPHAVHVDAGDTPVQPSALRTRPVILRAAGGHGNSAKRRHVVRGGHALTDWLVDDIDDALDVF